MPRNSIRSTNHRPIVEHTGFTGINNVDDPLTIGPRALRSCTDYDNTKDGRLVIRPGQTLVNSSSSHSIWSNANKTLCIYRSGSDLLRLHADESSSTLASGFTGNRMIYRDGADGEVYLTDGKSIGMIRSGVYTDISSYVPYDHFKNSPISGVSIEFWNGTLFIISGDKVYFSDPFMPFQFDMKNNVINFSGAVTLFRGMASGIFASDGKIMFISGNDISENASITPRADYNAIFGSDVLIPGSVVGRSSVGMTLWFATEKGIAVGGDDGSYRLITERNYHGTFGEEGAGLYRHDLNMHRFIYVGKS